MRKEPVVVIDKKSWNEATETVAKKLAHQVYVASMEGNNDECLAFVEGLEARVILRMYANDLKKELFGEENDGKE